MLLQEAFVESGVTVDSAQRSKQFLNGEWLNQHPRDVGVMQ